MAKKTSHQYKHKGKVFPLATNVLIIVFKERGGGNFLSSAKEPFSYLGRRVGCPNQLFPSSFIRKKYEEPGN